MVLTMEEKRIVYEIEDFITILEIEKREVKLKLENRKKGRSYANKGQNRDNN